MASIAMLNNQRVATMYTTVLNAPCDYIYMSYARVVLRTTILGDSKPKRIIYLKSTVLLGHFTTHWCIYINIYIYLFIVIIIIITLCLLIMNMIVIIITLSLFLLLTYYCYYYTYIHLCIYICVCAYDLYMYFCRCSINLSVTPGRGLASTRTLASCASCAGLVWKTFSKKREWGVPNIFI
jgi:hypothetical protein